MNKKQRDLIFFPIWKQSSLAIKLLAATRTDYTGNQCYLTINYCEVKKHSGATVILITTLWTDLISSS